MPKFRKNPVEVRAIRLDLDGDGSLGAIASRMMAMEDMITAAFGKEALKGWKWRGGDDGGLVIPTAEGEMLARNGDWIICGVAGEFYPCKPDIFAQTYDLVE